MIVSRLIKIILSVLGVSFITLEVMKYEITASVVCSVMLLLLTFLYYRNTDERQLLFFMFLLTFSLSTIVDTVTYFISYDIIYDDYRYFLTNFLYILSYVFLIILCLKAMNLKAVFSKFSITILVLVILGVFCVTFITETIEQSTIVSEYILEFVYNITIMILVSVGLINYMYREDNKAMLFFIGTMMIFFSEMIQLTYYYILDIESLAALYSILLVLAFVFLYLQSQLELKDPVEPYADEQLEA